MSSSDDVDLYSAFTSQVRVHHELVHNTTAEIQTETPLLQITTRTVQRWKNNGTGIQQLDLLSCWQVI